MAEKKKSIKLVTGDFLGQFMHVFEPEPNNLGGEPRYALTMVFPNEDALVPLKAAAAEAAKAKWGDNLPQGMSNPFKSSDTPNSNQQTPAVDWGFGAGTVYVKAKSKFKPGVAKIDESGNVVELINPGDLYSGCTCKAEVSVFAYEQAGNRGVRFQLENILKVKDGEGDFARKNAVDVFGGVSTPPAASVDNDPFGAQ